MAFGWGPENSLGEKKHSSTKYELGVVNLNVEVCVSEVAETCCYSVLLKDHGS